MASLAYFKRTLPAPTATADGFVCVLNEDWFLQANSNALDGTTFANGGGNLVVYEDTTLTSRLSVDVVSFVTGASPIAEVWIRLPTYSAAKDVYISADDTQTTQPLPSSAFGQYDVWQDYDFVAHFNEVSGGAENSTGNSNVATVPSSNITRNVTGKVGSCYRFNGSQSAITPDTTTVDYWNESFSEATIGIWAYVENDSSGPYVLFEEGGSTNGHAIFYRTGPHTWHYSCTDSSAETELSSSTVTLPNSGWVFVVGVYEGGNCKLYINGTQEDTGFRGSSIGTHSDSTGIGDLSGIGWAGNTGTGNGVPFNGLLDTPFRSSIPFDSSRISATFDNQSDISSFGTSSDWTIPSSSISVELDNSNSQIASNNIDVEFAGIVGINLTSSSEDVSSNNLIVSFFGVEEIALESSISIVECNNLDVSFSGSIDVELSSSQAVVASLGLTVGSTLQIDLEQSNVEIQTNDAIIELGSQTDIELTQSSTGLSSNNLDITLFGDIEINTTTSSELINSLNLLVSTGEQQQIGNVTAGFAANGIGTRYKEQTISVRYN